MTAGKPIKTIALMMLITAIGKVMGVVRDHLQAVNFGADTAESIAFASGHEQPP